MNVEWWALVVSVVALVISVGAILYTRRQTLVAEAARLDQRRPSFETCISREHFGYGFRYVLSLLLLTERLFSFMVFT